MCRQFTCLQRVLSGLSLLFFAILTVSAQYRFDRWTTDEGLPQNTVNGLIQARDGYIWGVTANGIIRFDGVRFKVFNKTNTEGLDESRFLRIIEDGAGRLWFLSDSLSFVKYEKGVFTTYSDGHGFEGRIRFYLLFTDLDGNLIFSTDKAQYRYEDGKFEKFEIPTANSESVISLRDREGGIWLSDKTGLRRILGENVTRFEISQFALQYIPLLYEDRFGNIWLSYGVESTYRIHDGRMQHIANLNPYYFVEDFDGNLWIGAETGLYKLSANELNPEKLDPSRIEKINGEDFVYCLTVDREGGIWAGLWHKGLWHITRQAVRVFSKTDWNTKGDNVYPIFEDRSGNVWLGTWSDALIKYDKNYNFKVYQIEGGEQISSIFEDSLNRLWLGLTGKVGYFNDGKFTPLPNFESGGIFVAMTEDNEGNLWFGTESQGLYRFSDGNVTRFTTADGLPNNGISALLLTKEKQLLVGTLKGLAVYQNGKFSALSSGNEFVQDHIRSLYQDASGVLWIGTYDSGLIRFKDGKFKRISQNDGMFNGNVFCTLEDENGWFWINSNNGIYRVRKQQLNDFADGKIQSVDTIAYNKSDGLLNIEGNGGKQPAGIRRSNGELWFPTQQGVAVINPNDIAVNPQPPPVRLEDIFVNNKDIGRYGERVEIQPEQNNLEINYTGLSFVNSPLVKFRYRLEGLETDWNEVGMRRTAFYNNLPPGEYRFHVLAANRDGVWNEEGASIKIVKLPYLYQRWWFIVLASLSVAGIVGLIFYYRVSQLRRIAEAKTEFSRKLIESQESERKRIASELHDGLGQSLVVIKNRAMLGIRKGDDRARVERELGNITESAAQALDEVREITNDLRPQLIDRLGLTKAINAMLKKVSGVIELKSEIDPIDQIFNETEEINVYRIIQESLNNIIKHSDASEATVIIECRENRVLITIEDNGKGFDAANVKHSAGGLGLVGLKERAQLLNGEFSIDSKIGKGTKLKFRVTPSGVKMPDYGSE